MAKFIVASFQIPKLAIVALAVFFSFEAIADTAENILKYSESQLLDIGQKMAEGVSRSTPTQIDSVTMLLGAIFVKGTKTFIYKYETSTRLEPSRMAEVLPRSTCADRIRKSLMTRGFAFKHLYITPSGQQELSVKIRDCN